MKRKAFMTQKHNESIDRYFNEEYAGITLEEWLNIQYSHAWSQNPEIALAYARGLVSISYEQDEAAVCQTTIDELKMLSDRWVENAEIVLEYAKGLFNLSNKKWKMALAKTRLMKSRH